MTIQVLANSDEKTRFEELSSGQYFICEELAIPWIMKISEEEILFSDGSVGEVVDYGEVFDHIEILKEISSENTSILEQLEAIKYDGLFFNIVMFNEVERIELSYVFTDKGILDLDELEYVSCEHIEKVEIINKSDFEIFIKPNPENINMKVLK